MRLLTAACLLMSAVAVFADDPPKPITEAIASLKKAASAAADEKEKAAIIKAIRYLEASIIVPKNDNAKLADFVDFPAKYKGKRLVFEVTMDGDPSVHLEHMKGNILRLYSYSGSNKLVLMAELPKDALGLPNMRAGDTARLEGDDPRPPKTPGSPEDF